MSLCYMTKYEESDQVWELLFGASPDEQDIERWKNQKFDFHDNSCILNQTQGGPCGILAPVQAFLIQRVAIGVFDLKSVSSEARQLELSHVLNHVLSKAKPSPDWPCTLLRLNDKNEFVTCEDGSEITSLTLLEYGASIVATRSVHIIRSEMDDPTTHLIERFGHCSQELLNLMLIGKAFSNVFDREKTMGILLRGIPDDATVSVGLLSELEHLRYVTVGTKLKNPELPFWVLGSSTHYTVLFSFDKSVCDVPGEVRLRERIVSKFSQLHLDEGLMDPEYLNAFAASLGLPPPEHADRDQLSQSGIVILEDALKWAIPKLEWREEFKEKPLDIRKEFDQFYLINNQTPENVYSVKKYPSGGSSSPDASLVHILQTKWPQASFVVSTL